jgi:hypothetical protein
MRSNPEPSVMPHGNKEKQYTSGAQKILTSKGSPVSVIGNKNIEKSKTMKKINNETLTLLGLKIFRGWADGKLLSIIALSYHIVACRQPQKNLIISVFLCYFPYI